MSTKLTTKTSRRCAVLFPHTPKSPHENAAACAPSTNACWPQRSSGQELSHSYRSPINSMAVLGALNDIKQGLTVVYNDEPYLVLQANFVRMQQRKPVMQTKMRHLITGKILEYSFKPGDRVETADIGRKKITFLYRAGAEYAFMDNETFEQISFTAEQLGEQV